LRLNWTSSQTVVPASVIVARAEDSSMGLQAFRGCPSSRPGRPAKLAEVEMSGVKPEAS